MSYDKGRPRKTVSHPHALSVIDKQHNQRHIFRVDQYGDLQCERGPDGKLKPDVVQPLPIVVDAKVSEIDVTCKSATQVVESEDQDFFDVFEDCAASDSNQPDDYQQFDDDQQFFN